MRFRPPDTELVRFPSAVAFDLIMLENAFDWLCVFARESNALATVQFLT